MGNTIGIIHRTKKTAKGESRPTMVALIRDNGGGTRELRSDTDELDFVLNRFPDTYRDVRPDEDITHILPRHIKTQTVRDEQTGQEREVPWRIPATFVGLQSGDTVAMMLGGSGDRLAFALTRRANEIGARVVRIPPFLLKAFRGQSDPIDDHLLLASLVHEQPSAFRPTVSKDLDLIMVRELLQRRRDAQRARIACEQQLRQRAIGSIFLSEDGRYPEGSLEDYFDSQRASDDILTNLTTEEARREAELRKAVRKLEVWQRVFSNIEGCGEVLAAGIIAGIGDIRLFSKASKLTAFCGVHVLPDGRIARRRSGEVANWHPDVRQALYLLADQWFKRPNSVWGKRLRATMERLRQRHPEPIVVDGKKRYGDLHIRKMAIWRTLTRFVEFVHREWTKIETEQPEPVEV